MALIKCPECGQMVSTKADRCPHCGRPLEGVVMGKPVEQVEPNRTKRWPWILLMVILLLIVGCAAAWFFIGKGKEIPLISNIIGNNVDTVELTPDFIKKIEKYDQLGEFSDGMAAVHRNGKWGYINTKGDEIVPCKYNDDIDARLYVRSFSDGMAAVLCDNGKYGFVNKKGDLVISPNYEAAGDFSEGLACVTSKGKENVDFIDKEGKVIPELSGKYCLAERAWGTVWIGVPPPEFKDSVCELQQMLPAGKTDPATGHDFKYVCVNHNGKIVSKTKANKTNVDDNDGYTVFSHGDSQGIKDSTGHIVLPAKYSYVGKFHNGVALVYIQCGQRDYTGESDDYLCYYGYADKNGNCTLSQDKIDKVLAQRKKSAAREAEIHRNGPEWIQGTWCSGDGFNSPHVYLLFNHGYTCLYASSSVWTEDNYVYEGGQIKLSHGGGYMVDEQNRSIVGNDGTQFYYDSDNTDINKMKSDADDFNRRIMGNSSYNNSGGSTSETSYSNGDDDYDPYAYDMKRITQYDAEMKSAISRGDAQSLIYLKQYILMECDNLIQIAYQHNDSRKYEAFSRAKDAYIEKFRSLGI